MIHPRLGGPRGSSSSPSALARCTGDSSSRYPLTARYGGATVHRLPPFLSHAPVKAYSVAMARSVWVALVCWPTPVQE
ncbi:Uncharacterised protein [Bordetella pertussis]|nr:Uncharacterised protein [Bordetella pertussis]